MHSQLKKAVSWLNKKCNYNAIHVYTEERGLVAVIFKWKRDTLKNVWYCVELDNIFGPAKSIRRICAY